MRYITILVVLLLSVQVNAKSPAFNFDFYNGDFESAKVQAGAEGKLFFVDFYATWCAPCKWMEETTFTDVEVSGLLSDNYISVKVDIDDLDGYGIKERYQVRVLPTIMIFNSKGEVIARVEETLSPRKLAKLLAFHNTDENRITVKHTVNTSPKTSTSKYKSYTPKVKKEVVHSSKPANQKYRIQLGVFQQFENTYDLVNTLKSKFIEPVIVLNDDQGNEMVYKVMMGSFATKEEADDFKEILERDFSMKGLVR